MSGKGMTFPIKPTAVPKVAEVGIFTCPGNSGHVKIMFQLKSIKVLECVIWHYVNGNVQVLVFILQEK